MSALALIAKVERLRKLRAKLAAGRATAPTSRTEFSSKWRNDPARFFREALGIDPWSRQLDVLSAVRDHDFVAVRSGQKVSKSNTAAGLAWWWATTRPDAPVFVTAPTYHQLENILWPEIRQMHRRARVALGPAPAKDPGTGVRLTEKGGIFGVSTDKPERLQGLSGPELLFIVDEASGYPEALFEAVFGNLSGRRRGKSKVLLLGNPTQVTGTFADAFRDKRDNWTTIHIDSRESPNFHGGNVPGLATPDFVEWATREWGEDSPMFAVRIRGDFPEHSSNSIVPLGLIEKARDRHEATVAAGRLELGVDVARYGDDQTAIYARRGLRIVDSLILSKLSTDAIVDAILQCVRSNRSEPTERASIKIDVTGGLGAGPADAMRRHHANEVDVYDVNFSSSSDEPDAFPNVRTQIAFGVTKWLAEGGALPPNDSKLHGELAAARYDIDARGRRRAEPKDEIKKRLKRSPDRADALALSVYQASARLASLDDLPAFQRAMPPNRFASMTDDWDDE